MSARAVPFYCPYCGEESLVPDIPPGATGEGHGHWACRSCRRAFRLSLTALASATTATASGDQTAPDWHAPEENG
jgi:transposase-like protein